MFGTLGKNCKTAKIKPITLDILGKDLSYREQDMKECLIWCIECENFKDSAVIIHRLSELSKINQEISKVQVK